MSPFIGHGWLHSLLCENSTTSYNYAKCITFVSSSAPTSTYACTYSPSHTLVGQQKLLVLGHKETPFAISNKQFGTYLHICRNNFPFGFEICSVIFQIGKRFIIIHILSILKHLCFLYFSLDFMHLTLVVKEMRYNTKVA